jgi:LytS/YehU family sensor histidine kinase
MIFVRVFRSLIVSTLTWFAVYYYKLLFLLQRSRLENARLKHENLQAQLTSLREQISPHFLFNSLNTLSTLSTEETVKEYILKLSQVYRYVLHYQQQDAVPVSEELSFINSYVYILESRFEAGLKVNIRIDPACLDRKILPFALQLLVENAVKHNAISYTDPLAIDIYDKDQGLVVENDLRARVTMHPNRSTGLANLSKRYRLAADKEICIVREAFKFKVQIPFLV